jgi:hypothetical protein
MQRVYYLAAHRPVHVPRRYLLGSSVPKVRVSVPEELKAKVLFASDHTCCVCQERGVAVQMHHLDENPTENREDNLAVLCLECHNRTQLTGGFGRHLARQDVVTYRDDWVRRVKNRRDLADQIAAQRQAGVAAVPSAVSNTAPPAALLPYVESLPTALAKAYELARPRWEEGPMSESRRATYEVIDVLEQMLVHLAGWCRPNHFGDIPAAEFFSQHVSGRFLWRRGLAEHVHGGNITVQIAASAVLADVEDDVAALVEALIAEGHRDEWASWSKRWAAVRNPKQLRLG